MVGQRPSRSWTHPSDMQAIMQKGNSSPDKTVFSSDHVSESLQSPANNLFTFY